MGMKVRRVQVNPKRIVAWMPVSKDIFEPEVRGLYDATVTQLKMMLVLTARDKLRNRLYLLYPGPVKHEEPVGFFLRNVFRLSISADVEILNPQLIRRRPRTTIDRVPRPHVR
jgi:hypothetical protein